MSITAQTYAKIQYYREHTDKSKCEVAKELGIARNTVIKYWQGERVPWERKTGSGRKSFIITDKVKNFIRSCLSEEQLGKIKYSASMIYRRLTSEQGFKGSEVSVRKAVAKLRKEADEQNRNDI